MNWHQNKDELYHHGIKGQRWGVRRFQNMDGTLTSRGKQHEVNKDERKKKLKKILAATITAAVVVGAAYAGKKYLDSKNAQKLMEQKPKGLLEKIKENRSTPKVLYPKSKAQANRWHKKFLKGQQKHAKKVARFQKEWQKKHDLIYNYRPQSQ